MMGKSVITRRVSSLLAPRAESSDNKSLTRFGSVKPEWAHDIEQEDMKSPLRGLIIAGLATIGVAFGGFLPGLFRQSWQCGCGTGYGYC